MSPIGKQLARFRRPVIFGVSAAMSRAGGILAVPIAAQALTLQELGYYSLCVAFIQILCQFLSLGGAVAVARAGADNVDQAHTLAMRFSLVAIGLGALVSAIALLVEQRFGLLTGLVAMIAALEAHQQLYQLVIRAQEREVAFLSTSALKAFAWPLSLLVYILASYQGRADLAIEVVVGLQLFIYATVSFVFVMATGSRLYISAQSNFAASILLSVPMVLHAFAQWIMSSADRIILGKLTDSETLGFYSLAYSLASVMFVIVSGMALYLPHEIMKRVSHWGQPDFRLHFLRWYGAAYFLSFSVLVGLYTADYLGTNLLRYRNPEMFLILGIAGAGFLFTGVYHVYVPFLFAAGKTKVVTAQTLKACIFYLVIITPLIHFFAAVGAAIGTLLVWIYYMISIRSYAVAYLAEKGIGDQKKTSELLITFATAAGCLCVSFATWASVVF
ncbi:lipopolysaccharide biosynthesis protein [Shinella sumterensis]|uniref:lipopolysaccharide biosynthesis protein n=1 Tax=Shinella sumterensis TaxID=1967501 RepID=UPI003F84FA7C